MINVSSETPQRKQFNTDTIKAVVAGDWVSARLPYRPTTKFKPYAKHFLAMNETPTIDDSSHGMWRRIYIITFPRTFSETEMDVYLTEKLRRELSGIFNWALEGYKRLRKKNFIFTEGKSMRQSKQSYKDQSNSVLAFVSEYLEQSDPEDKINYGDLYEHYAKFCEIEGYSKPYRKRDFRKTLEASGFSIDNSKKDNNKLHVFGARLTATPDFPLS